MTMFGSGGLGAGFLATPGTRASPSRRLYAMRMVYVALLNRRKKICWLPSRL